MHPNVLHKSLQFCQRWPVTILLTGSSASRLSLHIWACLLWSSGLKDVLAKHQASQKGFLMVNSGGCAIYVTHLTQNFLAPGPRHTYKQPVYHLDHDYCQTGSIGLLSSERCVALLRLLLKNWGVISAVTAQNAEAFLHKSAGNVRLACLKMHTCLLCRTETQESLM